MIEVHPNPERAYSDGVQSLLPEKFTDLINQLKPIAKSIGKEI